METASYSPARAHPVWTGGVSPFRGLPVHFSRPQTSGENALEVLPCPDPLALFLVSSCLFRTELLTSECGFGGKPCKGGGP